MNFGKWIRVFLDAGMPFIYEGEDQKTQKIESEGNTIEYSFLDLKNRFPDFDSVLNKKLLGFSTQYAEIVLRFENDVELLIFQPVPISSEEETKIVFRKKTK